MTAQILILCASILFLFLAGELTVRGAVNVAAFCKIHPLIIGLTLLSIGTSLPELFVSVIAALNHKHQIVLGNIIGSNIANTLLVLGVALAFSPLNPLQRTTRINAFASLAAAAILFFFLLDLFLSRFEAALLLAASLAVVLFNFKTSHDLDDDDNTQTLSIIPASLLLIIGLLLLPWSSQLLVNSASHIAQELHISETIIGLTAVALGTSLPELVTTIVALIRKHHALSLGNIIGSNLFNLILITGAAAMAQPLAISITPLIPSFLFMTLVLTIPLFPPLFSPKFHKISGTLMILSYFIAISFLSTLNVS